ncbi:unnamed protein product [Discosporangium mesarthrocarpum]
MTAISHEVQYPLGWIASHGQAVISQVNALSSALDLYSSKMAEGVNFRSSMLKKDPLLQFVATNLHLQVLSVCDPMARKGTHYDFTTTGAPVAHKGGYKAGGLTSLEESLGLMKETVLRYRQQYKSLADASELKRTAKVENVSEMEEVMNKLRKALVEYEMLSFDVGMRRVCVGSQVVSIAAASFCLKLEMMARGTLNLETSGCSTAEELARRWVKHGFLIGFEGLLSILGKEQGMVEDTVIALDMLSRYTLQVVPASPDKPPVSALVGMNGEFEMEVGIDGNRIQCHLSESSMAMLPTVLWTDGGQGLSIFPVFFTQGIDIQQSMSNASGPTNKKASFQLHINADNLSKLNDYCHQVQPMREDGSSVAGRFTIPYFAPKPRPLSSAETIREHPGQADLLGLFDHLAEEATVRPQPLHPRRQTTQDSQETHPSLIELESAVRHSKLNEKNTAILLEAQLAVRRLGGGRVTFCKSGKDRTAMSVTLEEALILVQNHVRKDSASSQGHEGVSGVLGSSWRHAEANGALRVANVLRAHGARLIVAEKNVGRPKYSFNALQRQFIPELYQPPLETIQDVITSALNRDS